MNNLIHLERCDLVDYWKDDSDHVYWSFVEGRPDKIYGPFRDAEDAYWDVLLKFGLWTI